MNSSCMYTKLVVQCEQIVDIVASNNLLISLIQVESSLVNDKVCQKLESDIPFDIKAMTQNIIVDRTSMYSL